MSASVDFGDMMSPKLPPELGLFWYPLMFAPFELAVVVVVFRPLD
jgi:hypothetical protein